MSLIKDPLPGNTIGGRYRVRRKIGSGSVADVYLVTQENLASRPLALRLLKEVLCKAESGPARLHKDRFFHEANFLAGLRNPAFARVMDSGAEDMAGVIRPWVAMEYIQGSSLHELAASGMDMKNALSLARQLAWALMELHGKAVVLRDLSSRNILVQSHDSAPLQARLFDFSHAAALESTSPALNAKSIDFLGSPPFSAPELVNGQCSYASDIYSLGYILLYCLQGQALLSALSQGIAPKNIVQVTAKPIPGPLLDFILRCISPISQGRISSTEDFLEGLSQATNKGWFRRCFLPER